MSRRAALEIFHPAVTEWFAKTFPSPTTPQRLGWPAIARGESTLMLAPTGSGKTLAAFLWCLNRLMFSPAPPLPSRCRVLYVSPLKALAVDVERNLRAPLAGIAAVARAQQSDDHRSRDRDSHGRYAGARPRALRSRPLPTSSSRRRSRSSCSSRRTRASVSPLSTRSSSMRSTRSFPSKRGAHLALSLERLEALRGTDRGRCSASVSRRRSGRSKKLHVFSVAPTPQRHVSVHVERRRAIRAATSGRHDGRKPTAR